MLQMHALIIDDNAFNVEVLERLLSSLGGTYTAAQDPTRVVEIVQRLKEIDVVFLDLEMPKRDGYQMLAILRQELGMAVPIVAYTVHTSEIDYARRLGFDGFLGKPLDPDRFPGQLERILNGEPVWD
jgi:two-component system cell cycle response regulator DivK